MGGCLSALRAFHFLLHLPYMRQCVCVSGACIIVRFCFFCLFSLVDDRHVHKSLQFERVNFYNSKLGKPYTKTPCAASVCFSFRFLLAEGCNTPPPHNQMRDERSKKGFPQSVPQVSAGGFVFFSLLLHYMPLVAERVSSLPNSGWCGVGIFRCIFLPVLFEA